MDRFSVTSLLHRSAAVRLAARGAVFMLVACALIGIALNIPEPITTPSLVGIIVALILVEAALILLVKSIFKKMV